MKRKQVMRRLLVAVLACVMTITSVGVVPVAAEESGVEVKTESLFSETFERDYWNSSAVVAAYGFTGTNDCGSGRGEKFYLVSQKGALYMLSNGYYGHRSLWQSVNVPKGEMLTIEFDLQPGDKMASLESFKVGILDEEPSKAPYVTSDYGVNMFPDTQIEEGQKIKIEIAYAADGSAVYTTYTKNLSDANAGYAEVKTGTVPKEYATDGVTNVCFYAVGGDGTYITIDNLDIYRTYTIVPDTSIVYEKKSQFIATFDKAKADLINEVGFTGSNDCGSGQGALLDAFVSDGCLQFYSKTTWGQRSVWKSVRIPQGEKLIIEYDVKAQAGTPNFIMGLIDEEPYSKNITGTILYKNDPTEWIRVKVEVSYNADGSAVSTAYTKSLSDANAEYVAVANYTNVSVPAAYATDGSTNVYFFSGNYGNCRVDVDNVDIYTVHAYKNGKCTVCGDYKDEISAVAGYNLTLQEGTVGLNFHMDMSAKVANLSKTEMRFTVNGKTQTMAYNDAKTSGDYRVFTCEVAAKQMADEITAIMYNDGVAGTTYTYSVKEYANKILADSTTYANEIPLVQALLNYGTYAQQYFGYNTENLANGGTYLGDKALSSVTADSLSGYTGNTKAGNDSVKLVSASLILESKTALRLYLNVAEGVNVEGLKTNKNGSYIEVEDILPQNLADDVTVNVAYGDNQSVDITYNCMSYCYNVLRSNKSDALKNVVSALCLYNQSAATYVGK